jgi:uncharacterized membrane protein YgcG
MRRLHAIAIALLLGAGIAAGAAASLETVHLGTAAAATPATVPDQTIATRRATLARWSASLQKARAAHPPALPEVPRYAPVQIPTMPALPAVEAAAPPTPTTTVERSVAPAPATTSTGTTTTEPAQATYVQPPPIVQYRQAPAVTTPATSSGESESEASDGGYSASSGTTPQSSESEDGHVSSGSGGYEGDG